MKILFEDYEYKTSVVEGIIGDFLLSKLDKEKDKQILDYVGYFFNREIVNHDGSKGDLVFILPKVILDKEGKAFGLAPEEIINFNYKEWKKDELVVEGGKLTKQQVYSFIYGFATWIYRAVDLYRKNLKKQPKEEQSDKPDNIDKGVMSSLQVGKGGRKKDVTFVDILLSLLDFHRTHKDFITFTIKMSHSGFNKVSWPKTIARTQAVIQDGSPIYLNPINKQRVVNFDEELLIIYYSILDYMHEEYGFPIPNQPGYKLIKGAMFRSYLKSRGKTRLLNIRYKYYSDSAVLLWNLCYAFFDKANNDNIKANDKRKDYLLVRKFETVFEAMIDELVGDKNLPKGIKVFGDDKRIDHLYTYKYLLENMNEREDVTLANDIYNIADSKYYRRDMNLRGHDVPKQFTYVRNVIQWHMDLLNDLLETDKEKAEKYKEMQLFDQITEGYNIIPNFFISAQVEEDLNYDNEKVTESKLGDGKGNVHESYFFWERLFDRNSYFTLHYDVNFLFVLKMYAQDKSYNKFSWKQKVREQFRKGILKYLNDNFKFYQILIAESTIDEFVEKHYRKIIGKIFSFEDMEGHRILLYAERSQEPDKKEKETNFKEAHVDKENGLLIIPSIVGESKYKITNVVLGESKYEDTRRMGFIANKEYEIKTMGQGVVELQPQEEPILQNADTEEYVLFGYYKSADHLKWIMANKMYNTRPVKKRQYVKLTSAEINARYLILHNDELESRVFKLEGAYPSLTTKEELPNNNGYKPSHPYYMVYKLVDVSQMNSDEISLFLEGFIKDPKVADYLKNKKPKSVKLSSLHKQQTSIYLNQYQETKEIDYYSLLTSAVAAEEEK